ncbi:uncharacterized protein LOC133543081 isoform X3 [Nerophis ophidion]|uniref:uncharacterized protein LOC133543081 isoform X3 n=1 Tax=Nerophis ophidion TaxID=159077 RepID=UPI002ADFC127|nr:uncharacterized protein LOC133543081 isoform X3 [Nerophis ophidion]
MYFNCSCSVAPLLRCYINSSAQIMTQRHHWAPREHARVCCEHSVSALQIWQAKSAPTREEESQESRALDGCFKII